MDSQEFASAPKSTKCRVCERAFFFLLQALPLAPPAAGPQRAEEVQLPELRQIVQDREEPRVPRQGRARGEKGLWVLVLFPAILTTALQLAKLLFLA